MPVRWRDCSVHTARDRRGKVVRLKTRATVAQITELATAIAQHAQAIAAGTTVGDPHAVARLIADNADTLVAWTTQGAKYYDVTEAPALTIDGISFPNHAAASVWLGKDAYRECNVCGATDLADVDSFHWTSPAGTVMLAVTCNPECSDEYATGVRIRTRGGPQSGAIVRCAGRSIPPQD
jgi:hypothetical protein